MPRNNTTTDRIFDPAIELLTSWSDYVRAMRKLSKRARRLRKAVARFGHPELPMIAENGHGTGSTITRGELIAEALAVEELVRDETGWLLARCGHMLESALTVDW